MVLKLQYVSESLGECVKRLLGLIPTVFLYRGSAVGPRIYISSKPPGDDGPDGPGTTL